MPATAKAKNPAQKTKKSARQIAADERWDELLASPKSQEWLKKMAAKVRADRDQGLNEELDLDKS